MKNKINNMSKDEAVKFASSMRGQYIISQALFTAIETMEKVPEVEREESNISDMKYLMDTLFPIFKAVNQAQKSFQEMEGGKI